MSETTLTPTTGTAPATRTGGWITVALLGAIALIFALSMALAPRPTDADAEAFGGTDAAVTDVLAEKGVEPWFEPIFEPGSSEIESGLFALQAALGAGAFGFALGNLRGRRAERVKLGRTDG
ncbi:energy-coupling factor ABC transporter substrate-binding protein [Luteococcus sp. H138]|uniref:energy-coupling factor ABC transporter substrate-binding protein n=1 Tax=unclassified Luteococcus TaxID=2639923 RepID=UPI00313CE61F